MVYGVIRHLPHSTYSICKSKRIFNKKDLLYWIKYKQFVHHCTASSKLILGSQNQTSIRRTLFMLFAPLTIYTVACKWEASWQQRVVLNILNQRQCWKCKTNEKPKPKKDLFFINISILHATLHLLRFIQKIIHQVLKKTRHFSF